MRSPAHTVTVPRAVEIDRLPSEIAGHCVYCRCTVRWVRTTTRGVNTWAGQCAGCGSLTRMTAIPGPAGGTLPRVGR